MHAAAVVIALVAVAATSCTKSGTTSTNMATAGQSSSAPLLSSTALSSSVASSSVASSSVASSSVASSSTPAITRPPIARPPSALNELAGYLGAAAAVDSRLKAAAVVINGAIGSTHLTVTPAAVAAIAAANPDRAGRAIPAGLDPALLRPAMLVQSDLVSRYYSLHGFENAGHSGSVVPLSEQSAKRALECLGNGAQAAHEFPADLAALRAAAAQAPPVTVAAARSRAAAEVAIMLYDIRARNAGCGSCGGARVTSLPVIRWYPKRMPTGYHNHPTPVDGKVDIAEFMASYTPGAGWKVLVYAC